MNWLAAQMYRSRIVNLVSIVAAYYQIELEALTGRSRSAHLVRARYVAMYLVRQTLPDVTFEAISYVFRRDHSTVMHAMRSMKHRLQFEPSLLVDVESLTQLIAAQSPRGYCAMPSPGVCSRIEAHS